MLSRKFLSAMGIEAEKIDEIISAHRETVDGLKEERDTYKETAEKVPQLQKDLETANAKIKDFEDEGGKDKWKVKYEALKEESEKYRADVEAEKTKQRKGDAYKELLKEMGVSEKRLAAVIRVTDLDALELMEDGKLKDSDKLKESIKTEWSDFIGKEQVQGAHTETPPGGNGDGPRTPSRAAQVAAKRYEMLYGKKTEESK